ncbi:MAG TPA: hypothetical protein VFQ61_29100, partial [Polyangiaceae bacterium]|nr:hypothetical protein [Polyangiaceae bacterium]
QSLEKPLGRTELGSTLLFVRAQQEEAAHQLERARGTYEALVEREPYPVGPYWDEALLALSRLAERAKQFAVAASHLERLLSAREQSWITGSYERPAFAEARFHLAELWRDHLGSPERAYREFMLVYQEHTTSRLRDDAVFQAARIALRKHDQAAACRAARVLTKDLSDSRYARCAGVICPSAISQHGVCPAYIEAELSNPSTLDANQHTRERP